VAAQQRGPTTAIDCGYRLNSRQPAPTHLLAWMVRRRKDACGSMLDSLHSARTRSLASPVSASAFTLVECLVVLAIIGILTGLLLPSLNAARTKARGVGCMSNMRQLGIAISLYTGDYRGVFPRSDRSAGEAACWFYAIDPYLLSRATGSGQKAALVKQDPVWRTFDSASRTNWRTIKMNRKLVGHKTGSWSPSQAINPVTTIPFYRTKVTVADMANTVLLFDGRCEDSNSAGDKSRLDGWETYVARRHSGGANVVFVDGHAEWRQEKRQIGGIGAGWEDDQTTLKWWATE
jgi:prepilin-type processing-associated H-X9-DG protein/prepilin-type N-terminal cleavage/methylation domain-containing protein